ncbi:hypothetical protein HK100_003649, partial [Physocladia obscura]
MKIEFIVVAVAVVAETVSTQITLPITRATKGPKHALGNTAARVAQINQKLSKSLFSASTTSSAAIGSAEQLNQFDFSYLVN